MAQPLPGCRKFDLHRFFPEKLEVLTDVEVLHLVATDDPLEGCVCSVMNDAPSILPASPAIVRERYRNFLGFA